MKQKIILAVLAALAMTGCPRRVSDDGIEASKKMLSASGQATVSEEGFHGPIAVTVTLTGGKLTDVQIDGPNETAEYGLRAMDELRTAMLAKGSGDVAAVSGVTGSSTAIITAAQKAIQVVQGKIPPPPPPAEQPAPSSFVISPDANGEAAATAKGFGEEGVTVTVTLEDGAIVGIYAEGPGETDGVGSIAVDELPGLIMDKGGPDVDVIAGATLTSNAIISATIDAIKEIEGSN
jgi:uncharacterized protein with FMN-binding domain